MKTAPAVTQHRGAGVDHQRAQDFAAGPMRELVRAAIINGTLLSYDVDSAGKRSDGVVFAAGVAKKVPHRLGRKPVGWIVVRDFGANPHQLVEDATLADTAHLSLVSAAACTVYLWVF